MRTTVSSILGTATLTLALLLSASCSEKDAASKDTKAEDAPATLVAPAAGGGSAEQGGGGFGGDRAAFMTQFYAEAAEKLDVPVDDLVEALGLPPDVNAASEKLGIAVEKLETVLPTRGGGGGFGGGQGGGDLAGGIRERLFAEAAEKLGVTTEALVEAMGTPPSLEAASEALEIPLEKLQEAVQLPQGGFDGGGFGGRRQTDQTR